MELGVMCCFRVFL